MNNDEYKVKIGKDKMLIYHPDSSGDPDVDFIKDFQEAGSSNLETIQEFFIRLTEIQQRSAHIKNTTMQIELRNIKVSEHLSEETTAFTADLYVNSRKIAFVKNNGQGGSTSYQLLKPEDALLLQQTEKYYKSLPDIVYADTLVNGKPLSVPSNLENHIDDLVNNYLTQVASYKSIK